MQSVVMDVDGIDVCECGPQVHAKFKVDILASGTLPFTITKLRHSLKTLLSQGFETDMQLQPFVLFKPILRLS